jgi:hypothetical protein
VYDQLQTKTWLEILDEFDESSLVSNPVLTVRTPVMIYILSSMRELFVNYIKPKKISITTMHTEFKNWIEKRAEYGQKFLPNNANSNPNDKIFGSVRSFFDDQEFFSNL